MSDESPQKGWDNWFDAEQDSPGGGQQASEQQVQPSAQPESEPESEAEQTDWTMPAIGSAAEGGAAREETPARDAAEPSQDQRVQPKRHARHEAPAADALPTQQIAAVAENQPTQQVQAQPSASAPASPSQGAWQPEPARDSDPAPAAPPWAASRPAAQDPEPTANPWNAAEPRSEEHTSELQSPC